MLIAAGWSPARVGSALLRLRTEWDRCAKRPQMGETDRILLLGQLKALPQVHEVLVNQLVRWGSVDAKPTTAAVLAWWLHPTCPACGGTRYQVVKGTNRHSNRICPKCQGQGVVALPGGQMGRRLANHMDDCLYSARSQISRRLRGK